MRLLLYKLADSKGKIQFTVLYELDILLTHFMNEYFNSFDDIQFFHTFSSISRDIYIVTLNKIHCYIQNFMLYKKIYFSSHKFAFSNLRFSPFHEHFRQLREKYAFKLKIKFIMLISSLTTLEISGENRFHKRRYETLKFAFDRTQIKRYASHIYIYIYILYNFCVEVFEKTISRTEIFSIRYVKFVNGSSANCKGLKYLSQIHTMYILQCTLCTLYTMYLVH